MKKSYAQQIKKNHKYHYFLVNKSKSIPLSSSNSNTEAKKKALEKLSKNINKLIGKNIIRIKIALSRKLDLDTINDNMIGGPIVLIIEKYLIKSPIKLLKNEEGIHYFFYKQEEDIKLTDLKLLAFKFRNLLYNASIFNIKYVKKIVK